MSLLPQDEKAKLRKKKTLLTLLTFTHDCLGSSLEF